MVVQWISRSLMMLNDTESPSTRTPVATANPFPRSTSVVPPAAYPELGETE